MKNNKKEKKGEEEEEEEEDDDDEQGSEVDSDDGSNKEDVKVGDEPEGNNRRKEKKKKSLSTSVFQEEWLAETGNFNEKLKKRGVLYVARIPPRMTPTKLKSLLSEYGEVCRVYLVEEDKSVRQRRKKQGGSGSKRYHEGWVEFAKKRIAKHVALSLNNTQISNYKRSPHYGDLWNIKYLHRFKWSHLTEKVAYERRVREQKLRVEMMQARKENAAYVELVETGKKLDKIEERQLKRKRNKEEEEGGSSGKEGEKEKRKRKRRHQSKPMGDRSDGAAKKALLQALVQE